MSEQIQDITSLPTTTVANIKVAKIAFISALAVAGIVVATTAVVNKMQKDESKITLETVTND